MVDKEFIKQAAEEFLKDSESYLVDLTVNPGNQINIEIDSYEPVSIDECAKLSRFIESKLNRDEEDFELEVGSAGLSSPFKTLKQYQKNIGNEVEVLTKNGQKLYGKLKDANDTCFILTIIKKIKPEGAKRKIETEEDLQFSYTEVKYTKYSIRFK
ncbi:MAG: ribosome assembly cofactor RimP [Candidatus Azobacteroides sp.]|nr:ribosome assembly cofactor RimP [Candidatus Azobacteroides sp.]